MKNSNSLETILNEIYCFLKNIVIAPQKGGTIVELVFWFGRPIQIGWDLANVSWSRNFLFNLPTFFYLENNVYVSPQHPGIFLALREYLSSGQ